MVVRQPRQNRIQPDHTNPGRRQFDREGKAIQPAADLHNGRRAPLIYRESGLHRTCPLDEEGGGRVSRQCVVIRSCRCVWQRKGGEVVSMLPTDVQRLPAGDEELDVGTGRQQIGHVRSGYNNVFQVVQEKQEVSVSEESLEAFQRREIGMVDHAQRLGDRIQDETWIAHGGQIHEYQAIVKFRGNGGGQLHREPCLADPWRTRDGDKPHVAAQDKRLRHLQVPLATHQRVRPQRQSVQQPFFGMGTTAGRSVATPLARAHGSFSPGSLSGARPAWHYGQSILLLGGGPQSLSSCEGDSSVQMRHAAWGDGSVASSLRYPMPRHSGMPISAGCGSNSWPTPVPPLLVLLVATTLSVSKPRGMTRYRRRKQHEQRTVLQP